MREVGTAVRRGARARSASRRDGWTAPRSSAPGTSSPSIPAAGPRILLIGHLDTVFEPDSPFQKFERVGPTSRKGPGVIDMKGGDVIMIQALQALEAAGALQGMNVTVVMTGDEESSGDPQSRRARGAGGGRQRAHVAIGFEDGDGHPQHAVIGRRGTASWTLKVTGTPAHSSQIFRDDIGYGAVFEAARILNAFREKLAGQEHLTFNPAARPRRHADDVRDAASRAARRSARTTSSPEQALVAGDLRALSTSSSPTRRRPWRRSCRSRCRTRKRADHVRRRLPTAWRQPTATADCSRCTTRRAATSARAR